jgi:plasmid replication initiation protein
VATSIRQSGRRQHRFSWINEWAEHVRADGRSDGIELILADWFFSGVVDNALVLTLDPAYFRLTGGIERWLYRLVRKHAGRQPAGWRFDLRHLHLKSGSLQRYRDFALHVRSLVGRQAMPGHWLAIERIGATEWLGFRRISGRTSDPDLSTAECENPVEKLWPDSGNHPREARVITGVGLGESPAQIGLEAAPDNGLELS